jgi:hypothetical protein
MQKYGFETYLDNETFSDAFASDNCNKVFIDVVNTSNMFTTKLSIVVKDCKNTVLFQSEEGKSNEKEFKVAYSLALRQAFDNFSVLKLHKYQSSQKSLGMIGEPASVKANEEKVVITSGNVQDNTSKVDNLSLFVQPITNGFQIINTEPKVIYKILKTSTKDFYFATKGTIQGVFFLRNNEYFFEYYQNDKLVTEKVDVKF